MPPIGEALKAFARGVMNATSKALITGMKSAWPGLLIGRMPAAGHEYSVTLWMRTFSQMKALFMLVSSGSLELLRGPL